MVKLHVGDMRVELDPTGSKSKIFAGDLDITGMCSAVDVHTDPKTGTSISIRYMLADCRAQGHGSILGAHPRNGELLEIEEIRFKNGDRWKAVVEEKSK